MAFVPTFLLLLLSARRNKPLQVIKADGTLYEPPTPPTIAGHVRGDDNALYEVIRHKAPEVLPQGAPGQLDPEYYNMLNWTSQERSDVHDYKC